MSDPRAVDDPIEFRENERVVLELGQALHRYGTPAHRLELVLEHVAAQFGLVGQFFAVPTAIIAAFGPLGAQRSGLVRLDPGAVDLGKLSRLDEEVKTLAAGAQTPHQALIEIQRIVAEPAPYPLGLTLACFGLASAAGAFFFGGDWLDAAVSLVIGIVLGILAIPVAHHASRHVYVPLAAATCAALAQMGQWVLGPYRVDIITLAGLLHLLPGLTITVALTELSSRHLVSGTARLTVAALVLLELTFGVALGGRVALLGPLIEPPTMATMPVWINSVALIVAALAFLVLFRARIKDSPAILVACVVAFYGARFGARWLGPQIGAWLGSMLVALCCNAYARLLDRPPTVPLVPAILLLVPGSIGLRSMTWLLQNEAVKAIDSAFETAFVGIALAVGILVANVTLTPRRDL